MCAVKALVHQQPYWFKRGHSESKGLLSMSGSDRTRSYMRWHDPSRYWALCHWSSNILKHVINLKHKSTPIDFSVTSQALKVKHIPKYSAGSGQHGQHHSEMSPMSCWQLRKLWFIILTGIFVLFYKSCTNKDKLVNICSKGRINPIQRNETKSIERITVATITHCLLEKLGTSLLI